MTLKKKLIICLGVIIAVAFVAGMTGLAAGTYGSQSDPLVAKSYLDETVTPQILAELDGKISAKAAELTASFNSLLTGSGTGAASEFKVVTLTSGQVMTCQVGTEIMLRVGSAESYGPDSPRLVDETDGTTLTSAGSALVKNHMYMVTIVNNGIKSTGSTKVLVRGTYTIG